MTGYRPISIIEYSGFLTRTGESQGHYTCDVKDAVTNLWFKTNDNCDPIQIEEASVSKDAYVVLFKRML